MIISLVNTKGGVAKTMSTMYIASALRRKGSVWVWDADPQGSATEWASLATQGGDALEYPVTPVNVPLLRSAQYDTDYVVVDTPPGEPRIIEAAVAASDVVIVPTKPDPADIRRMWATLDALTSDTPRVVLLTVARTNTINFRESLEVLREADAPLFSVCVSQRESISRSFGTQPKDLYTYTTVVDELLEAMS